MFETIRLKCEKCGMLSDVSLLQKTSPRVCPVCGAAFPWWVSKGEFVVYTVLWV